MPRDYRCRRTRRDDEAGLLFRWRIPGGSLGRTVTATAAAVLLFALVTALFEVRGLTVRTLSRETAHLLFLPPDTEEGRQFWESARQNSPFPDRWELDTDSRVRQLMEVFEAELAQRAAYRPLLRPLEWAPREFPLPELFDPSAPALPPVPRPAAREGPPEPVESRVVAVATASETLVARWNDANWAAEELLAQLGAQAAPPHPRELLGLQRRFLVMVDRDGLVVFCQGLNEVVRPLDEVLAARLRQARFAPAPEAEPLVGGYIDVAVRDVAEREEAQP